MSDRSNRLTRRQQRLSEKTTQKPKREKEVNSSNLQLKHVAPVTDNQIKAFNSYDDGQHLCMLGSAGTGKTYCALYLALKDVLDKRTPYKRVVIVRTAQPTKQIGFLPGKEKDKMEVYEVAYRGLCAELFGRGDAYEVCKQKGLIEFLGTSFLRGVTIDEAIVIVEEVQGMSWMEIHTLFSRLGSDARLIISGDTKQDDLTSARYNQKSGIAPMIKVLSRISSIDLVTFGIDDIVRSGWVREWITAYEESGVDPAEFI